MDIERGNIEIVFQKIPYMYVIKSQQEMVDYCSYSKMEKDIYMRYSSDVFSYATDDERSNNYSFMCSQMKLQTNLWKNDVSEDIGVFQLVFSVADKMLRLDGNEIKCKFDQLLRWREITLLMGQDFFTCAYLACLENGGHLFLIKVFQIFWNLRYFCEFCYFSPYIFIDKYLFWGNSGENERTKRRMDK